MIQYAYSMQDFLDKNYKIDFLQHKHAFLIYIICIFATDILVLTIKK